MFTCPVSGGGTVVFRPSASSGTITSAGSAYDLPSSRPDDPPYTTSADRATVTGSAVAGTVDYDVVEFNTFGSRSKSNFSQCNLVVGISNTLNAIVLSYGPTGGGHTSIQYITSDLTVDYQINGTDWINIKTYHVTGNGDLGPASNSVTIVDPDSGGTPGDITTTTVTKETINVVIPASSFLSNLSSLKVRFRLGTCKNNVVTTYQSSGSYSVWDIRANIS